MRRTRATPSVLASSGFTLLEVIIAMGILAVGATASLALLVSATSTGRRGEHYVNTALIADSVFAEADEQLHHENFTCANLEVVDSTPERSAVQVEGPIRAVPPIDPKGTLVGGGPKKVVKKAAPPPAPPKGAKSPDGGSNAAPKAFAQDPFAGQKTFWLKKDQVLPAYPDYKYNVAITPVGGPTDEPWEFLIEVVVRWSESGKRRSETYQTVLLKRIGQLDNEAPPDPVK